MHLLEFTDQSNFTMVDGKNRSSQSPLTNGISYDNKKNAIPVSAAEVLASNLTLKKPPQPSSSSPLSSSAAKLSSAQTSIGNVSKHPRSRLKIIEMQKKPDALKNNYRPSNSIRSSVGSSSKTESVNSVSAITSSVIGNKGKYQNTESIDFVRQISKFLTLDGIHSVVDKIRTALENEKEELMTRMKQLESTMEGDCDLIITCRSSNGSTPRLSEKSPSFDMNHGMDSSSSSNIHDDGGSTSSKTENSGSQKSGFDSGSVMRGLHRSNDSDSEIGSGFSVSLGVCDICGARLTSRSVVAEDQDSSRGQATSSSSNNKASSINGDSYGKSSRSSSSSSARSKGDRGLVIDLKDNFIGQDRGIHCVDCKSKKRRERVISGRLSEDTSISSTVIHSTTPPTRLKALDRDKGDDGTSSDLDRLSVLPLDSSRNDSKGDPPPPSSRFRNKLQAARDEHHFIADDYFLK